MSRQQVIQSRSFTDGFNHRRVDRETGNQSDNKLQPGRSFSGSFSSTGFENSRDQLIFLTTCLIGHHVDVQVKNGSIFSGIFHATNAEKDFGIILKMARLIKDVPFKGQKPVTESISKAPSKTLIIPAKELVQVLAKDVQLTVNGLTNGHAREKRQDIMIDSFISQSYHADVERELERWTPDKDDPECPGSENIFANTWNRNWDQFETNEALFGVKSTFDEELYTTKLERGPQMREREREASRIAREIEGEETQDPHLAEERGLHLPDDFELDEESRFSSVIRGVDDGISEENEDTMLDARNAETFGGSSDPFTAPSGCIEDKSFSDVPRGKISDGTQASASCASVDEGPSTFVPVGRVQHFSDSNDHGRPHTPVAVEETRTSKSKVDAEKQQALNTKKSSSDKGALSPSASAYAPTHGATPHNPSALPNMGPMGDSSESIARKAYANPRARPGSATSSTSDCAAATSVSSCPSLSPSSSLGSLSSEKSTLNPYAKEFKLNPNAKSFTPSLTSLRPPAPVSDSSFYLPANALPVQHMHSLPMGVGIGPSFGAPQPIIYNPQGGPMQSPQPYIHPHGHMYGQQMILPQPRQVIYMPTSYPPEMQFKGRDF